MSGGQVVPPIYTLRCQPQGHRLLGRWGRAQQMSLVRMRSPAGGDPRKSTRDKKRTEGRCKGRVGGGLHGLLATTAGWGRPRDAPPADFGHQRVRLCARGLRTGTADEPLGAQPGCQAGRRPHRQLLGIQSGSHRTRESQRKRVRRGPERPGNWSRGDRGRLLAWGGTERSEPFQTRPPPAAKQLPALPAPSTRGRPASRRTARCGQDAAAPDAWWPGASWRFMKQGRAPGPGCGPESRACVL